MSKRLYLIAYDIADPDRLRRVARFMVRHGVRVQYSVFAAELSQAELQRLLAGLEEIIDPRRDDIRAYPLPYKAEVTLMGPQLFPDHVMLVRDGLNYLSLALPPDEEANADEALDE